MTAQLGRRLSFARFTVAVCSAMISALGSAAPQGSVSDIVQPLPAIKVTATAKVETNPAFLAESRYHALGSRATFETRVESWYTPDCCIFKFGTDAGDTLVFYYRNSGMSRYWGRGNNQVFPVYSQGAFTPGVRELTPYLYISDLLEASQVSGVSITRTPSAKGDQIVMVTPGAAARHIVTSSDGKILEYQQQLIQQKDSDAMLDVKASEFDSAFPFLPRKIKATTSDYLLDGSGKLQTFRKVTVSVTSIEKLPQSTDLQTLVPQLTSGMEKRGKGTAIPRGFTKPPAVSKASHVLTFTDILVFGFFLIGMIYGTILIVHRNKN